MSLDRWSEEQMKGDLELRESLQAMSRSNVNIADYEGTLFDVVFDILTADTFVAGIATKILDGESIPPNERVVIRNPLLEKNSWIYERQPFDLSAHPAVLTVARAVEHTRALCCRIIDAG
jgi:hypothetical protein